MRRLCVLTLALFLGTGCVTDADRKQWQEAWRDLRGDNMEMKSSGSAIGGWGINEHK
jgi:hypothetical protein